MSDHDANLGRASGSMSADIDPSALIHSSAIVETGARIGARAVIHPYAVVTRFCEIGEDVEVHSFAAIGGEPQDLHFDKNLWSGVRIGARSVIREHVTINRATKEGAFTEVGCDCYLMTASHVAHDGKLGNHVIMANAVLLGGHAHIEDRVTLGGGAVIHQFCRVGQLAMVGGGGRISQDVPRFCLATERNALIGLNSVGLRRNGINRDVMLQLRRAFRLVNAAGGNPQTNAEAALSGNEFSADEALHFLQFYRSGRRGFVRTRRFSDSQDS